MKISQIIDKEIDLNRFEHLSLLFWHNEALKQIDLSSLTIDSFVTLNPFKMLLEVVRLPNNHFTGLMFINLRKLKIYPMADSILEGDDLNAKEIESLVIERPLIYPRIDCFYDDKFFGYKQKRPLYYSSFYIAENLFYSRSESIKLSTWKIGIPYSWIGLKQKIWIAIKDGKVWIYDINLDSYSEIESLYREGLFNSLFVSEGKIYMIERAIDYKIYVMDDKLLEWILLFTSYSDLSYEKCTRLNASTPYAYYEGMIYFFRKHILYEFNLKNNESRVIGYLRDDGSLIKF